MQLQLPQQCQLHEHSWCFNPTSTDKLFDISPLRSIIMQTIFEAYKNHTITRNYMFERIMEITQSNFIQILIHSFKYIPQQKDNWLTFCNICNEQNFYCSGSTKLPMTKMKIFLSLESIHFYLSTQKTILKLLSERFPDIFI